jgi:excisionase family DNA binding protein
MKRDLTVQDVAKLTGVHPATVRRLARVGRLPGAYKMGSLWRFAREGIEELRGQIIRSTYHADIDLSSLQGEAEE